MTDAGFVVEPDAMPEGDGSIFDASEMTPGEKAPTPQRSTGKRTSTADFLSLLWGGVGTALVHTGADVPVGRVLQLEAPLAGSKIDAIIAGTWLDGILQPLVKQADRVEGLGALIAFPVLIGLYERNAAIGPVIEPVLRQVVESTLLDMAPLLKKKRSDVRRAAGTLDDLSEIFDIPKNADPVTAVLQSIFAMPADVETDADEQ